MSENEYERFEVTDYDLENEFNINRPRRRLTKNQQIYGIWADDSDNDSGGESSRRGRRGRTGLGGSGKRSKDYSAPVSFVAGGIHQIGKKDKDKEKEKKNDQITDEDGNSDDDEDDVDARPSFGRQQPKLMVSGGSDSSNDDSSSGVEEIRKPTTTSNQRNTFPQKSHMPSTPKNVGAWEQHTRGIGAKLLLQMGYEPGKGLGKDLQGISQPVEAHVRKGRGAIGAYGPETAASVGGKGHKPKVDEDIREAKEFQEQLNKWKKNAETRPEKTKRYYYKTVEEVIEKGKKSNYVFPDKINKKLTNVPVIDMTGPEKRVLSGYHALGQTKVLDEDLYELDLGENNKKAAAKEQIFSLPELAHNLQVIVNLCEQDIISLDNAERDASDKQDALNHELKNLEEIVDLEKKHINILEKAMVLVNELTENDGNLTLDRAEHIFHELQNDYAAEYKEFGLADLAAGVIAPLVKMELEDWQPLKDPTKHINTIKRWQAILDKNSNENVHETRNVFDPYSSLIWAGVIPSFRTCSASWDPKIHQPMAALLDSWAPLFPSWILDSVLEQLVLVRLSTCVREWDPLTDTVPIHLWILPWSLVLGTKMEEFIYPTIREKLGGALRSWMPQDRSARAMLTPFRGAFNDAEMQMFLMQHIIPKLQIVLNEFIINPVQQDLEPWNQVWEWHELIPPMLMAQLLDKFFFPKWMQVLAMWLNQSPDFSEISRWYSGWKSLFSEELLREPNVKEYLRRALEMMHRATDQVMATGVSGINILPPTIGGVPSVPQQPPTAPLPSTFMELQMSTTPAQLEFKELVSQKCAERGIIFAPMPGRRELGKQVYRVGKLYCYIDRNVCMLSDNSFQNWTPTSLGQLMERAMNGIL